MTEGRGQRFLLERYLSEELPEPEREELERALEEDAALREQLEGLRRDQESFLQEMPYAAFRIEHERRLAPRPSAWQSMFRWFSAAGALGAVAALALWVTPIPPDDRPTERIKGSGVGLSFGVLDDDRLRTGSVGELLPAGTTLQLTYDAGDHGYLALIGIDGGGQVDTYYPESGDESGALPAGARGRLPFSLTLDDTAGVEKFFAVFSAEPLPLETVLGAARKIAHRAHAVTELPLSTALGEGHVAQATVWVRKP